MDVMNGLETHNVAMMLIDAAVFSITLTAYTLDLGDLVTKIIAASKRGVSVVVIVDQGHTISGATKDQASQMGQLVQQGKLRIRLARGVKPKTGLQHSKTLLVDRYLICGSTNWTMHSQKCNEISLLVRCDDAGLEAYKKRIAEIEENSEKMTTFDVYRGLVIRKEREEAKEAEKEAKATAKKRSKSL